MVEVQQVDRDAAAELGDAVFCHPDIVALAFTRHRQAGVQQGLDMAAGVARRYLAFANLGEFNAAIRKLGGGDA